MRQEMTHPKLWQLLLRYKHVDFLRAANDFCLTA